MCNRSNTLHWQLYSYKGLSFEVKTLHAQERVTTQKCAVTVRVVIAAFNNITP